MYIYKQNIYHDFKTIKSDTFQIKA